MGSCCSTYLGTGKRNDTGEVDIIHTSAAVAVAGTTISPQHQSSWRWNRKKSGADESGDCNSEMLRYPIEIPGRMFMNGASKIACLYTQQGKKGINQDAMVVWEGLLAIQVKKFPSRLLQFFSRQNFSSRSDTVFCGVFDGHGPFGHMVAKKVRDSLPLILHTQWKANSNGDQSDLYNAGNAHGSPNILETASPSIDDEWFKSLEVDQNKKLPELYLPLKHSILKAFKLMDKELNFHPTIDCFCSGTTAVTVVKQGHDLVIGNVGDSRAVLATRDKDNSLIAVQLTVDLKPDLPGEAARIHQCKGRVFALQDEPEVARVWLPNNDSPGLAMARAFGDFCLKDFGLISIPDVYHHHITERDEFIILATDGVWDVLSNKEAVDIVASAPGRTTAARALVDCAIRAWRLKYPTSKNDDCAVVCLFLDYLSAGNAAVIETDRTSTNEEVALKRMGIIYDNTSSLEVGNSHTTVIEHSDTLLDSDEIVPVSESRNENFPVKCQSKKSLAECISTADDDEWSALEGITRVNSLLSIPRFLSGDRRAAGWRKWL